MNEKIDIIFDGPPLHEAGRFVEVENTAGQSIRFGKWVERPDGYWALRISLDIDNDELQDVLYDTLSDGEGRLSAYYIKHHLAKHNLAIIRIREND